MHNAVTLVWGSLRLAPISQSSSTTTAESNMKSEHNLYLEKRCWNILRSWWNILGAGGDVSEDVGTYLRVVGEVGGT